MNRRQFLIGSAVLAGTAVADEKLTDGGFAEVSWPDRPDRDFPVLPPGARSVERFRRRCVGCHLCTTVCPSKILRPSTKLSRLGLVELDFRHGYCRPDCVKCSEVCFLDAIEKLTVAEKRNIHVGYAEWTRERCVRTTAGDECHACEKHCPVKAVKIVDGVPTVDRNACIGCGACEHYCPARPQTAIRVVAHEHHLEVGPMSENDLVFEMRTLLRSGKTLVVAKDGVIVFTSEARMVGPIKAALAEKGDILRGAIVLDKVVGKAAAKMHAEAGVRMVITPVIAAKAKTYLENRGIVVRADDVVEKILNRDQTGECPLDAATEL